MSAGAVADGRLGGKGSESLQQVTLEQPSAGWPENDLTVCFSLNSNGPRCLFFFPFLFASMSL